MLLTSKHLAAEERRQGGNAPVNAHHLKVSVVPGLARTGASFSVPPLGRVPQKWLTNQRTVEGPATCADG